MKVFFEVVVAVAVLAIGGSALLLCDLWFFLVGRHKFADWVRRNQQKLRQAGIRLANLWKEKDFFPFLEIKIYRSYCSVRDSMELGRGGK